MMAIYVTRPAEELDPGSWDARHFFSENESVKITENSGKL